MLSTMGILENAVYSLAAGENYPEIRDIPYYMMYRISMPNGRVLPRTKRSIWRMWPCSCGTSETSM